MAIRRAPHHRRRHDRQAGGPIAGHTTTQRLAVAWPATSFATAPSPNRRQLNLMRRQGEPARTSLGDLSDVLVDELVAILAA